MLSDSPFARAIVVGVIGGTISELSGDKFLNGAGSAVFAELFNHAVKDDSSLREDFVEFDQEKYNGIRVILTRSATPDGTLQISKEEFGFILDAHVDYLNHVEQAFGKLSQMSQRRWGEVRYLQGDSVFYGSAFGGTAFFNLGNAVRLPNVGCWGRHQLLFSRDARGKARHVAFGSSRVN